MNHTTQTSLILEIEQYDRIILALDDAAPVDMIEFLKTRRKLLRDTLRTEVLAGLSEPHLGGKL